jgi:hypothetical protein
MWWQWEEKNHKTAKLSVLGVQQSGWLLELMRQTVRGFGRYLCEAVVMTA